MYSTSQRLSRTDALSDMRRSASGDHATQSSPAFFLGISPSDYESLAKGARSRLFAQGEILHLKGDAVQYVFLLMSGVVKITQPGENGTEVILRVGAPGDVLGAASLFSTGKHDTTAHTIRACHALMWEARVFSALAERFPVLHRNMARILGGDLAELGERFREVTTERVGARVARQLLRLRTKIGWEVGDQIRMELTRKEIAEMTGTTLFTVSRLLADWEEDGTVKSGRGAVNICDVQSLRAKADQP